MPEVVTGQPDGHLTVAYGPLVAVLIEAFKQEHEQRVAADQELQRLRGQVVTLSARLDALERSTAAAR